jgi:hypothetical protein
MAFDGDKTFTVQGGFARVAREYYGAGEVVPHPTSEHLRKRALIQGGFYSEHLVDAGSNAAALRVAAFMRSVDPFAMVVVRGPFAIMRTASSQSRRAMGAADFQRSKTAVLEIVSDMIGVAPAQLERQGEPV